SGLYSNIYVISYSEGASEETQDIYSQVIENISFLINVADTQVCSTSGNSCSSDLDCSYTTGEVCGSDKLKIMRDTRRIADMKDIAILIDAYGEENGTCSGTTTQTCELDADCPSSETCEVTVPTLSSGTAVRSLASSGWSSWVSTLGGAVNDDGIPVDPLNAYTTCTGYSSDTCVNTTTGAYSCPVDSHVYHYRAVGARDYEVGVELEYTASSWVNVVDSSTTDNVAFYTSSFCDGNIYGTSSTCGDGIIGTNVGADGVSGTSDDSTETCEIGDLLAQACTTESGLAGTANADCNSTCSGYTLSASATCSATSCGDGVINGTEICDDGANNGEYGYCG
ncbi:MAG: hypothetical protein AAB839_00850, partial [Patescibacteria group bacterium]